MKKIYTLANMAKGMMLAALLAVGTTALAQNVSGNTENGTVEGTENGTVEGNENGSNENETFAPAAESSWLQPVKLVGNGQKAYIYNVATETFITGKTATVKNIEDADVWTIDGDETRCFNCDNAQKERLFLEYSSLWHPFVWYAEVSHDRDATDFTIVEGSTKNSYKLTKSREKLNYSTKVLKLPTSASAVRNTWQAQTLLLTTTGISFLPTRRMSIQNILPSSLRLQVCSRTRS